MAASAASVAAALAIAVALAMTVALTMAVAVAMAVMTMAARVTQLWNCSRIMVVRAKPRLANHWVVATDSPTGSRLCIPRHKPRVRWLQRGRQK